MFYVKFQVKRQKVKSQKSFCTQICSIQAPVKLRESAKKNKWCAITPIFAKISHLNGNKRGSAVGHQQTEADHNLLQCEIFAIPESIYICICFAQGDIGIQGIQGVSGAQVLHAYFIPTAPHHSFYMFLELNTTLVYILKGGKGVKGPKGKVSCDSGLWAPLVERNTINGSYGSKIDTCYFNFQHNENIFTAFSHRNRQYFFFNYLIVQFIFLSDGSVLTPEMLMVCSPCC